MTTPSKPSTPNRLADSTSPYLLQHAHNPVDWYEWGDEAFEKAAREDKPVFLSIGYSACHWCHVMAHESFEDADIAAVLNAHFVSVKVDREERPDVDAVYMQITQAMNAGRGGWPMSVFLTPDRKPFFAGTYFPPLRFKGLLEGVAEAWRSNRDAVLGDARRAHAYLLEWATGPEPAEDVFPLELVDQTARLLARHFDMVRGGIDSEGNKFPPCLAMDLLLRVHRRTKDPALLKAVTVTLDNMARGGIYDHVGGGICRYSTDPDWHVPHFEKMLYDQALVSSIYLDAYQVTRDPLYADMARDIFDYVMRDLQSPEGGFYSARDADSDGMEGAYYVWTREQIEALLGAQDAALFCDFYDVTREGNWVERHGHAPPGPKNILRIRTPIEEFTRARGLDPAAFRNKLTERRTVLRAVRSTRNAPGLDDKILTDWNGLMIASLARGAAILEDGRYGESARRAADFLLARHQTDGRLLKSSRAGKGRLPGLLDDYAFMVHGLLETYGATGDQRYGGAAVQFNRVMLELFYDKRNGSLYASSEVETSAPVRHRSTLDGAIPSGSSIAVRNLLRIAPMQPQAELGRVAESILKSLSPLVRERPAAYESASSAGEAFHEGIAEIRIVGDHKSPEVAAFRSALARHYLPNLVMVYEAVGEGPQAEGGGRKLIDGRAAAYLCHREVCLPPVSSPESLIAQLTSLRGEN